MATYEQQRLLIELIEKTQRVVSSRHGLWLENLSRWFDVIDSDAAARDAVHTLESSVDFDAWHQTQKDAIEKETAQQVRFPRDRKQSLDIRLKMFRAILDEQFDTFNFGLHFLGAFREQDIVTAFSQDIFSPMADDLNNYLTEYFESIDKVIPAADRIVPLDHNRPQYQELVKATYELRDALEAANDYPDEADRAQRLAELSAGIELIKADQVRSEALRATLWVAAKWIAGIVGGSVLGAAAVKVVDRLFPFLGLL